MAVGRYDTPARQEFINTYTPMPFNEMAGAIQYKQQQYEQGAAAIDAQIRSIDQIQAIPDSADESYLNRAKKQLHQVALSYSNKDLSDPLIRRQLDNEIRSTAEPERLNRIQQSYSGYQMYNKSLAQLKQRGRGTPQELLFDFTGYDSQSGVFADLPEAQLDYEGAIKDFFGQIKMEDFPEVGLPSGRVGIPHGRSEDKMMALIQDEANLALLMKDPRMSQRMRQLGVEGNVNALKEILSSRMPSFIERRMTNVSFMPQGRQGTGRQQYPSGTVRYQNANENVDPMGIEKALGKLAKRKKDKESLIPEEFRPSELVSGVRELIRGERKVKDEKIMTQEQMAALDKIKNTFPTVGDEDYQKILEEFRTLDPEETAQAYMDMTDDLKRISTVKIEVPNETIRTATEQWLADDTMDRSMWIYDSKSPMIGPSSIDDDKKGSVLHELGYTADQFKNELRDAKGSVSISGVAHDSPQAGSIILQVTDHARKGTTGKGIQRKVHITSNGPTEAIMQPSKQLHDAINGMLDVTIAFGVDKDGQLFGVRVAPKVSKIGDKWKYNYSLYKVYPVTMDEENNILYTEPLEKNQLTLAALNKITRENFFDANTLFPHIGAAGEGTIGTGGR